MYLQQHLGAHHHRLGCIQCILRTGRRGRCQKRRPEFHAPWPIPAKLVQHAQIHTVRCSGGTCTAMQHPGGRQSTQHDH